MEHFGKIVIGFKALNVSQKQSILDVWQVSEYVYNSKIKTSNFLNVKYTSDLGKQSIQFQVKYKKQKKIIQYIHHVN